MLRELQNGVLIEGDGTSKSIFPPEIGRIFVEGGRFVRRGKASSQSQQRRIVADSKARGTAVSMG